MVIASSGSVRVVSVTTSPTAKNGTRRNNARLLQVSHLRRAVLGHDAAHYVPGAGVQQALVFDSSDCAWYNAVEGLEEVDCGGNHKKSLTKAGIPEVLYKVEGGISHVGHN